MSFAPSLTKLALNVPAAVKHVQYLHVFIVNGIDDHVLPDGKAAQAGP